MGKRELLGAFTLGVCLMLGFAEGIGDSKAQTFSLGSKREAVSILAWMETAE